MIDLKDAKLLIGLGRSAVLAKLEGRDFSVPEEIRSRFSEKAGVFTTIHTYPEKKLRGCVGIPYPVYPLWHAVVESSISAAFGDPRFTPIGKEEFYSTVWELSILTAPEPVRKEDLFSEIKIGKHGLIVEKRGVKGLLLPQVPVEHGWDVEKFLSYTCLKAGLNPDCWKEKDTKIFKFEAKIFEEIEPLGDVIERDIGMCGI